MHKISLAKPKYEDESSHTNMALKQDGRIQDRAEESLSSAAVCWDVQSRLANASGAQQTRFGDDVVGGSGGSPRGQDRYVHLAGAEAEYAGDVERTL